MDIKKLLRLIGLGKTDSKKDHILNKNLQNKGFEQLELSEKEEERWKNEIYDMSMSPREWMARFGHTIICGDGRMYKYKDKDFEKWISEAYDALNKEGLELLWKEFLLEEEIAKFREEYENL